MTTAAATTPGYQVAELAELVGVRPDTIRYYERAGLLPASAPGPPPDMGSTPPAPSTGSASSAAAPASACAWSTSPTYWPSATPASVHASPPSTCSSAASPTSTPNSPPQHATRRTGADDRRAPGADLPHPQPGTWLPDREGDEHPMSITTMRLRRGLRRGLLLTPTAPFTARTAGFAAHPTSLRDQGNGTRGRDLRTTRLRARARTATVLDGLRGAGRAHTRAPGARLRV